MIDILLFLLLPFLAAIIVISCALEGARQIIRGWLIEQGWIKSKNQDA